MRVEKQSSPPFPFRELLHWTACFFRGKEQEFYNRSPAEYERIVNAVTKRYEIAKVIAGMIDVIFGTNRPHSILDAACGTGIMSHEIVKHLAPGGRMVGVDLSQPALDHARQTKDTRIEWRQGDFHHLPISDKSIDLYHMFGAYRFTRPEEFWQEVNRVLVQDGIAMVTHTYPDMTLKGQLRAQVICRDLGLATMVCRLQAKGVLNRLTTREILVARKV